MKSDIQIGSVRMPLNDFVVSRNAILGITKSGKTYTAKGIAEQLLDCDIPIIVFDAIGVWRYLKMAGDGPNAKGYKIVVAGGERPDFPLTPQSAPVIVRAAIKENIPLVIDLYDPKLSKADWRRIVQASFRILLYENKGLRHVFLEESAEFAPQKVMDGETYAEVEKLARMGGNKHVGITFINQRAQELNKAVLELCDNVILLRQRGSHAIDALEKWLDRLSPDTAKEIANSMPHMTQGDCWIFTENSEVPVRTKSGLINSLHPDRRMPEQALSSRKAVDADSFVQQLRGELTKLIEETKANDPALMKNEIARLQKLVDAKTVVAPAKEVIKEVSTLTKEDRDMIARAEKLCSDVLGKMESEAAKIIAAVGDAKRFIDKLHGKVSSVPQLARHNGKLPVIQPHPRPISPRPVISMSQRHNPKSFSPESGEIKLGGPEIKLLAALKQYPNGVTKTKLALLTRYAHTGGAFNNPLGKLRSAGLAEGSGDCIRITEAGSEAVPEVEPLPTGHELIDHWMNNLAGPEREIFKAVAEGEAQTKEELAARCVNSRGEPYEASGGAFNNPLGRLRTLGLITKGWPCRLSDEFYE